MKVIDEYKILFYNDPNKEQISNHSISNSFIFFWERPGEIWNRLHLKEQEKQSWNDLKRFGYENFALFDNILGKKSIIHPWLKNCLITFNPEQFFE